VYNDPLNERSLIREENNGVAGVYCWINLVNNKTYIGSGDPLYVRLCDYYQVWYYLSRPSLYILRALKKYGMENFSLAILEYTDSKTLISCEQK
jgi:group I intron endonuclease